MDLALLEGILASARGLLFPEELEVEEAALAISATGRRARLASIARQLGELMAADRREKLGFEPDRPVAIGISGGRLRIAFMHPDMGRFFGPAWQMPIGAGDAAGRRADRHAGAGVRNDRRIHLYPDRPPVSREHQLHSRRQRRACIPARTSPICNAMKSSARGMSETLLLSLGYFSDEELERPASKRTGRCRPLRSG